MNCQEALSLLYEIIDQEASEVDVEAVKKHLAHCRHCSEIYRVEGMVNDFLHAKVKADSSPAHLDNLRTRILDQLDDVDNGLTSAKKKLPYGKVTMFLAAAASLVLLIGVALMSSSMVKHRLELVPIEQAHWDSQDNPDSFANPTMTTFVSNLASQDMHYALAGEVDQYGLIGGIVDTVMGIEMAHFLYQDDRRYISVFLAPAAEFEIPDSLQENRIVRGDIEFYDHFCRGCRVVFHRMGDVVVITATTEKDIDLLQFVPGRDAI